jgi:hypothetical protein
MTLNTLIDFCREAEFHNELEKIYRTERAPFKIASVKSMIMSLWKVDDEATQEMMVLFYSHWLKLGDKRKAFTLAQKEIRERYKFPFYWGAFVLLGG